MRILNWMHNKLTGRPAEKKSTLGSSNRYPMPEAPKEEFSDWPQGLLAIGTFGNNQLKEDLGENELPEDLETYDNAENSNSSENLSNFTEEEVGKLQKELTKLLALKRNRSTTESGREKANLPLDTFLNCPSSLEVDRINCLEFCEDLVDKEGDLTRNSSVILSKGKDVYADNKKVTRLKTISFLLKKMFVCQRGCSPTRSLRDPVLESRMEKLLRAILQKKINTQNAGPTSARMKYLANRHTPKKIKEDYQEQEKTKDGYKWVKTDSDFIVLEM
ncbi:hypothetical protein MRB53_010115 [Persea americana]|uniref:Uncharacterized protein n=1 Tax=Persea americana TaxID=3435 RepID=A0ACC2LRQ4_PERAE|nr:hypothetical protein MRB53_010115 [Persea americana]